MKQRRLSFTSSEGSHDTNTSIEDKHELEYKPTLADFLPYYNFIALFLVFFGALFFDRNLSPKSVPAKMRFSCKFMSEMTPKDPQKGIKMGPRRASEAVLLSTGSFPEIRNTSQAKTPILTPWRLRNGCFFCSRGPLGRRLQRTTEQNSSKRPPGAERGPKRGPQNNSEGHDFSSNF